MSIFEKFKKYVTTSRDSYALELQDNDKYWGRGIGTEAAKVSIEFARDDLKIRKLVALIMPENTGSIRIAEKLGITKESLIHVFDTEVLQYEMML